jgi:hypothetical protein
MEEELSTGASAAGVADKLSQRQAKGEFFDKQDEPLRLPGARSVQDYRKRNPRDGSRAWTFLDAAIAPADVPAVREALAELIRRSKGRMTYLTEQEARVVAVYRALGAGPWEAYVSARSYLAALARGEGQPDLGLWKVEAQALIEEGLEYRPGMIAPVLKEDPIE